MAAAPHHTNVSEIAMNAGFYHVARFAENYRRIFGELPSQTLKKQYTHIEDELCPLIKERTCGDVGRKL
jgi:AraC-like DNA-binding protein